MSNGPMPRLCFVGWADHVHVERWVDYFVQAGFDVSVVSFSGPGRYPEGVKQYSLGLRGRGHRWMELKLRYLFWRIRPDIVHVHWAHFAVPVRNAWRGPLVVTFWGSDVYRRDNFSTGEWDDMSSAVRATDFITCDSDDLAQTICGSLGVPASNVEVIQWGVDTQHFHFTGRDNDLARTLGLGDRPVVFSPRNFTPLYNQETIVRAFRRVQDSRPDAMLVFKYHNGDMSYRNKILALVDELGLRDSVRVVETIPYERMPDLYSMARVVVSVPFSDGTPMSLLEAMACGAVPICSDLPSLREWVTDGVNGFLVPVDDPNAIASRILQALSDAPLAATFAESNRQLVERRASRRVHMSRMVQAYKSLNDTTRVAVVNG